MLQFLLITAKGILLEAEKQSKRLWDEFLKLWRVANKWTRIIIAILFFCPLLIALAATVIPSPDKTIPLMTILIFIAAVVLFLIAIKQPLAIGATAIIPWARRLLFWLGAAVGISLLLTGLYFSAVPVQNDPWLVLWLIIAVLLLLVIVATGKMRWLIVPLSMLLVVLTIIFFFGGRKRVSIKISETMSAVTTAVTPTAPVSPPALPEYPACAGSQNLSYAPGEINKIIIPMHPECRSGWISIPADWPTWYLQSAQKHGMEIQFRDGATFWLDPGDEPPWFKDHYPIFRVRGMGDCWITSGTPAELPEEPEQK